MWSHWTRALRLGHGHRRLHAGHARHAGARLRASRREAGTRRGCRPPAGHRRRVRLRGDHRPRGRPRGCHRLGGDAGWHDGGGASAKLEERGLADSGRARRARGAGAERAKEAPRDGRTEPPPRRKADGLEDEDVARRRTAQPRGETMKLTPLDIRHKEFKRGMRGYADVEVDEFLDQVADEYERMFKENIDLQDRRRGARGEGRRLQAHRGHAPEDPHQRPGQRRGAEAERQQAGPVHPAGRRAQGAADGERGLLGAPGHRAGHGQAAQRRGGLPLQVQEHDRGLSAPVAGHAGGHRSGAGAADPMTDFARHAEAIKEAIARESAAPGPGVAPAHEPERPARGAPHAAPYVGRGRTRLRGSRSETSRRAR